MIRFALIAVLVVALLAFLVQILSKYELIEPRTRIKFGISLLLIALGIGIFSFFQDKNESKLTLLAQAFLQGKTLRCNIGTNEILATKEHFNFISGTLTLMGKKDGEYLQVTIPLKACELDNAKSN